MEILNIVIIGIISCLAMDIWQRLLKIMYDINPSDWAIVGRWYILLISKAKIYNPIIEEVPPIKNELRIGWVVHYTVAIMYSIFFFMLLKYNICNASIFNGFVFSNNVFYSNVWPRYYTWSFYFLLYFTSAF